MGARHAEAFLGLWLVLSPFVFGHADGAAVAHDVGIGLLVATLALASYARALRRAHLLLLAVAAWLLVAGWLGSRGGPRPAAENHVVVGLLLAMLAVVPSRATEPPPGWRHS